MEKRTCEEYALFKLNYKMYTEREMRKTLQNEEYEPEEIDETIDSLKRLSYIDDKKYAIEYFESARKKYWSDYRTILELEKKGIDAETSKEIINEHKKSEDFDGPEDDKIVALKVGYKMARDQIDQGHSLDDKFFGKLGRRLTTLGHSKRTVYYVFDKLRGSGGIANALEEEEKELERKKKELERGVYQYLIENR